MAAGEEIGWAQSLSGDGTEEETPIPVKMKPQLTNMSGTINTAISVDVKEKH